MFLPKLGLGYPDGSVTDLIGMHAPLTGIFERLSLISKDWFGLSRAG